MSRILFLNADSLLATLFWCNAVSFVFLCIYNRFGIKKSFCNERRIIGCLIIARLFHAAYYFLASGRDILPNWLSINFGNTLLLVGFYFEACAIVKIINEDTKIVCRMLLIILSVSVITFNTIVLLMPASGLLVTVASVCVVALMALPCIRMLFSRDSSAFAKSAAAFYCIFLLLLLPRAWYYLLNQDMGILTTNIVQSLAFLSQMLQLTMGLPAYILIIKEYIDDSLVIMATTDKLTGATNRHAFERVATVILENSKRYRASLSVLFIDIDNFKQINDKYGHPFGDSVLTTLSSIIGRELRGSDLSCRYGGEEFVALLSNSDIDAAQLVADRIMKDVRETRFAEQPDFEFTVSIGITSGKPAQHHSLEDIIAKADIAMYKAKHAGRNCCRTHDLHHGEKKNIVSY